MASEKIAIKKLVGSSNYEIWALRTEAFLIKEGLKDAITKPITEISQEINDKALATIRLLIEDGPLLQIQQFTACNKAWEALKTLYSPRGFTSEFLICKEFFNTTLDKYSSMEEYLNRVKQLSDQLKAKNLELPNQVIIAWVLNNLSEEYEGFVGNITQSLRNNSDIIGLETLFSNLLDESKRQQSKDLYPNNRVLYTRYKGKYPYKITKGQYCKYCKLPSHEAKSCFFLFPEKAPASWKLSLKEKGFEPKTTRPPNAARKQREENEQLLIAHATTQTQSLDSLNQVTPPPTIDLDLADIDMANIDLDNIEVFITTNNYNNNEKITNNIIIDKLVSSITPDDQASLTQTKVFNITDNNIYKANFIIDSAATRHIITDLSYFDKISPCTNAVSWGNAKNHLY